ncbi:MAG: hypothetical protein WEC75_00760 [Dehalococcoidia bacterium]
MAEPEALHTVHGRPQPIPRGVETKTSRRRGEVDTDELLARDTRYALHELRRIAVLATMVVVTLVVLAIVLR